MQRWTESVREKQRTIIEKERPCNVASGRMQGRKNKREGKSKKFLAN